MKYLPRKLKESYKNREVGDEKITHGHPWQMSSAEPIVVRQWQGSPRLKLIAEVLEQVKNRRTTIRAVEGDLDTNRAFPIHSMVHLDLILTPINENINTNPQLKIQ